MFLGNSPVTPDLTDVDGINSRLRTEPTRSIELATEVFDNNSETKDSTESDVTSEPLPIIPPNISNRLGMEGAISITLIIEIVVGCIVVMLFTATIAMWAYLCFKARAMQQRKAKTETNVETVENKSNSQMIYESIHEDTDINANGPMEPPHYIESNPAYTA